LGLAIVQAVVTDHGGTIEVESALGERTTFRIVLPLVHRAARDASASPKDTGKRREAS
jgi:signal transduction histidine kinase